MVPQAILHEIPNNSTIYKYTFVSSAYSKERHRRCENYMLLALNQSTLQDQYSKILTLFSFMILLYGCCLCGAIEHTFIYVYIIGNFGLVWFDFIPFVSFSCVLQLIFFSFRFVLGNAHFVMLWISCAHVCTFWFSSKEQTRENMPKPIFAQNKKYYTRNENMNERIEREKNIARQTVRQNKVQSK